MYKLIIGLQDEREYETFLMAFEALRGKFIGMVKAGTPMRPETVFIEGEIDGVKCPVSLWDILDLADDIGLLSEDREFREAAIGPEQEEAIKAKFLFAGRRFAAAIKRLGERRKEVLGTLDLF